MKKYFLKSQLCKNCQFNSKELCKYSTVFNYDLFVKYIIGKTCTHFQGNSDY
ncbi:MAG: hypothetical protein LBT51_06535 [Fusobacteriaceae bacterium]|jgi:hypothetical protein|nr:hypothetical protein [Fusobacteriaceae bacterium]